MESKTGTSIEPPRPSREEIAKREIGRTDISPTLAWVMVVLFLATIVAVPTIQSIREVRGDGRLATEPRWPRWCGLGAVFRGADQSYRQASGRLSTRVLAANGRVLANIHDYERRLEDDSFLTTSLLGPTQYWLTRLGGLGNEKAYLGRDGCLFYRPGVDYVIGAGFLEPAVLAHRASGGNEYNAAPRPDPRPAILEFQARLARSGVRLVLLPTPTKLMIEPERFWPRARARPEALQNPSFQRFKAEMEAAGVLVFDPTSVLLEQKQQTGRPQFLETDTHWTPDAMQAVAERLSQFIAANAPLSVPSARRYVSRSTTVRNLGDIAVMLKLPSDQDLFPTEEVTVHQVLEPDGQHWRPADDAEILLLGDSFTNIYSMPEMNWGESAGLAEQLSLAMGRAVDRIAQNDAGAYATRQALALELARGRERLAGKRVLIWQFAIRELASGDWKKVAWPEPRPTGRAHQPGPVVSESGHSRVRGRIKALSSVPEPGRVPYRDAILSVHLADVEWHQGTANHSEVVVYLWGMHDNRLTAAARYRAGQSVTLSVTPWEHVQSRFGRFTRVELDDPDFRLIDLPTYWADEAQ